MNYRVGLQELELQIWIPGNKKLFFPSLDGTRGPTSNLSQVDSTLQMDRPINIGLFVPGKAPAPGAGGGGGGGGVLASDPEKK